MKNRDLGLVLSAPPAHFLHVRDIEFFEGPLTSEFTTSEGGVYVFIWRDCDHEFNRWLVISSTKRKIAEYEARISSMHSLMSSALQGFLVDQDTSGNFVRWQIVAIEMLPSDYRSDVDSFFDPELSPRDPNGLVNQSILIDGDWSPDKIAAYPRDYVDVYCFFYALGMANSGLVPGSRVRDQASIGLDYNFDGGWHYRKFFNSVAKLVPRKERGRMRTLAYSSPGIIELRVNESVSDDVVRMIGVFQRSMPQLEAWYEAVHTWLLQRKKPHLERGPLVDDVFMDKCVDSICHLLGDIDVSLLRRLFKQQKRQYVEVILSFYRKVRSLAWNEAEGFAIPLSRQADVFSPEQKTFLNYRPTDAEIDVQSEQRDFVEHQRLRERIDRKSESLNEDDE